MSKIDKLSIGGIRSFGPFTRESIQFHTPLTLIVGYNGSGKTTIIECLKFATTGEMPPNSKGGAFIHDPRLCGEREIQAQVKLRFTSPPDTSYVVTRNLQLTVKKTTRSMKTLEGSLMTVHHGERNTLSSKKIDLDKYVTDCLGVSPAILDAVIFCHQDESLWPMSEPAALKKRFDEIFHAQKYIKAIDNLKVLRKKKGEELQKYKQEETHQKGNKEKADRCEKRSMQLQDEVEQLRLKCEDITAQMKAAEEQTRVKHEQANSFLSIVQDLENKQDKLETREEAIQELRASMKELTESDSWLQETLAQYEERVSRYQNNLDENKQQYADQQKELRTARDGLSERLADRGRHQSDKAKYERQVNVRIELIQEAASAHTIRGFDGDLDDKQVSQFHERIDRLLADKKRELEHLQSHNMEETDKENMKITELEGQKSKATQDRVSARQRIGAIEKRTAVVQGDLYSLNVDESANALLDANEKDVQERLETATEALCLGNFDEAMRHENDEIAKLDAENERLAQELKECTRMAADRAQLDFRKKELAEKKRKLDTLTNTWNDKLSEIVPEGWGPANLDQRFNELLQSKIRSLEEDTRKRDSVEQERKQVHFALANAQKKAKQNDDQMEKYKSAVRGALMEVINPDETPNVDRLPKEIEQLEEEILQHEKDIALYDSLKEYYTKCQKTLSKRNRCHLCEHVFADASEKSKITQVIKKALDGDDEKETREELARCEEHIGRLRAVRPQYDNWVRLTAEKPATDKEIQDLRAKEEGYLRQLEELDQIVRDKQEGRQDHEAMGKTVAAISQTHNDIEEAQVQVDAIMSQQSGSIPSRSVDEIQELQQACVEKTRVVKNKVAKLQADKQRMRDSINSLELEKSRLLAKISNAKQQLERKQDHLKQLQGLKDDMNQQRDVIAVADRALESVEPSIKKARAIRDDVLEKGRAKEKKLIDERDGLAASVNKLLAIESDIREYIDRGGSANLVACDRKIEALKQTISRIEKDMNELTAQTNALREEIGNSDQKKRNIQDNLNYRRNKRQVETLQAEIIELRSRNAHEDYDRLSTEARQIEALRHKLNAEKGAHMGGMRTKDEELARLLEEWETDYHDAGQKFREAHIQVETTKAAIEDVGRYSAALDRAIMQYHALKMDEVNRIAGELWQETYQGTDIDSIMIRADTENATTTRRSYNYRVCMTKSDTEMDMRGRCSAGQKVLASIIIRLALAETFGTNCGLIALDEPTTNLDSDNIKSLAESLHKIISNRQGQRNFQLIIITHDEEFLRHMRCSDFCDNFYRVKRDEKQNSIIQLESVAKLF